MTTGLLEYDRNGNPLVRSRLHGDNNQNRPFLIGEQLEEISDMSKSELENEYALLADDYEYISRVTVPEGTNIRVATFGP